MLRPDEFHVGDLASATGEGITLLLPRAQYEHAALIGEAFDQRYGVVLNGDLAGQGFLVTEAEPWEGILVPSVTIEADEKSAFDPAGGSQIGALIRVGTTLGIVASVGPHPRIGRPLTIVLMKELRPCEGRGAVGFLEWRIVVGEGEDKRELLTVSASKIASARDAAHKT
ncbi:MAG: hypothetical protein QOK17_1388 [Sphingomonadales bacterium]|jgi:hypothetical protein|nr:hypothetical protein [Sphingomonadales bacterium]